MTKIINSISEYMNMLIYDQLIPFSGKYRGGTIKALYIHALPPERWFESSARRLVFFKRCLNTTKYIYIYVYYQFINARRNKKCPWKNYSIYYFLSWWKIVYLIVFSPKFLLETLETKISVKKLFNIFFSIFMENNII